MIPGIFPHHFSFFHRYNPVITQGVQHALLETLLPYRVEHQASIALDRACLGDRSVWLKATALGCIPHAINGMSDHAHVAISIPPKLSIATTIGQLKGASSHHVNETYTDGAFAWQAEYGILSFSERSLTRVVDYVKNQKKHHAENTLNMALENFGLVE
jgi:hypothetical protein